MLEILKQFSCLQTIVEDPLMRHSAILVFANKQDLVSSQKAFSVGLALVFVFYYDYTYLLSAGDLRNICRKELCQQQKCVRR